MPLGYYLLLISFALCSYSIWAGFSGIKLKNNSLLKYARFSVYGQFLFATLSILLLIYAFLTRDFSILYVAEYSDRNLPLLYTISALWAGQNGSLFFWAWILTVLNAIFVFSNRKKQNEFEPLVFSIHNIVNFFFLILVIYACNPFERTTRLLADGFGLNPLLQNPEMIFHPPTLFLGFAGVTIPFAYGLAALIRSDFSNEWLDKCRIWALFAWGFLTIGNLLGAQWAYVELGWGGFWAWDPVENASLLPWLTATAFLHSLMVQKARKMFKVWNIALIITTFLLTILGTFITRSGIISSVHAFGRSNIGTLFLIFMGLIFIISLFLFLSRWKQLQSKNKIDRYLSKDFAFFLTNIILTILTVTILFGTLYPALTELFIGKQITLGEKFFNKVSIPFGMFLLLLLAICPLFAWKKTNKKVLMQRTVKPLIISVLVMIILYFTGIHHIKSLLIFGFCVLATSVIIFEVFQNFGKAKNSTDDSSSLNKTKIRRYFAFIIHIGVIMIFLAIVGTSAFKQKTEITLQKSEEVILGNYRLVYDSMEYTHDVNKDVLIAKLNVYHRNRKLHDINPRRFFYHSSMKQQQYTTEVAVRSNLKEDIYVILASYQEDESATFVIMVNPLMIWMWIGGIGITIGVLLLLLSTPVKVKRHNR